LNPVALFDCRVEPAWSLEAWREHARSALLARIAPEYLHWQSGGQGALAMGEALPSSTAASSALRVPAALVELAGSAICHRDEGRHALLYRLLWRVVHGEPGLLDRATDPDVVAATALSQSVRRDSHKMKAFVRFRSVPGKEESYVAWFEPEHYIVDRVAPFFMRRFAGMRWAILTPYRSAHWEGTELSFGPGGLRSDAPADDARAEL